MGSSSGANSRKITAILGSVVFAIIAPGTVAVLVPGWLTRWHFQPPFLGFVGFRYLGAALVLAGLPVLIDSLARFALQGVGTPAPFFPTRHLVVTGFYRHVRNPMYLAVLSLILGQAFLFGNVDTLIYGLLVCPGFFLFVLFYEQPTLRRTYGAEYDEYCASVPRWLPRLTPWRGL